MHSELFQLGPFTLRMYGFCMALGFLLAWQAMVYLRKRTHQPYEHVATLMTWIMVSSIVGARTAFVIEHWSKEFAQNPMAIFRVDQGGLMFYGGLIAASLICIVYTRFYRVNFFDVSDVTVAVLPLGQFFGRLGCFMHGCCYGEQTEAWYGVSFPKGSPAWHEQLSSGLITPHTHAALPVLPTQLIESGATLALFFALAFLYPRRYQQRGFVSGCYLIGYAVIRFLIEFLRGDPRALVGPISIGQAISLMIFVGGLACIAWSKTKGKTDEC
jgi:phosphatidylglycerol:prolipoprotein diacylglycerol transferase